MMDGPWQHDVGIKLKRFETTQVGHKAYLDARRDHDHRRTARRDEYAGYQNGTFDWARMPTPVLEQARATYEPQNQWITRTPTASNYLLVDDDARSRWTSSKARKAISMAIDRDAIINGVFKGSQTPADSFVPPVFKEAYQHGVCTACCSTSTRPRSWPRRPGLTEGTELNFQFNADAGHEEWTAAVKDQLETNLGLKVNLSGVQFTDLLDNEQQPGSTGIYRAAWGADYPTPGNFLQPLLSTDAIGATTDRADHR